MKNRTLIKSLVLSVSIGLMGQAQAAGNCSIMLDNLMNWAKTSSSWNDNKIDVTMTTNVHNRKFASYTTARLDYLPPISNGILFAPARLTGDGQTYFSDRTWDHAPPCTPGSLFCVQDLQPFSPDKRDKVKITLTKNLTDFTKANVSITLVSWGNAKVNFKAQCDNDHMYGFYTDHHGKHLYDLTFSKEQQPVIR